MSSTRTTAGRPALAAGAAQDSGRPGGLARRTAAQVRFDTLAVLRNGEQLLVTLIIPILVLVGLHRLEALALPGIGGLDGVGRAPAALAGALALAVASSSFTSPAIALAFDRRWGVLRMLATTPLGPFGLLVGRLGAVLIVLVLQVTVLVGVAALIADEPLVAPSFSAGPALAVAAFILLGAASLLGLGVIIGGTLRPEAVLALANTLWAMFAAIGGLILPTSDAPGPLAAVLPWLPTGALGDGLRSAFVEGTVHLPALAVLAVWAVVLDVIAARIVRWD